MKIVIFINHLLIEGNETMYNFILAIHILTAISLIGVVLIQRGRSGGLVEALGGMESIFGTKTSSFFVKLTVILAILFFITSISLTYLSKQKEGRSVFAEEEALRVETETPQTSAEPGEEPKP